MEESNFIFEKLEDYKTFIEGQEKNTMIVRKIFPMMISTSKIKNTNTFSEKSKLIW